VHRSPTRSSPPCRSRLSVSVADSGSPHVSADGEKAQEHLLGDLLIGQADTPARAAEDARNAGVGTARVPVRWGRGRGLGPTQQAAHGTHPAERLAGGRDEATGPCATASRGGDRGLRAGQGEIQWATTSCSFQTMGPASPRPPGQPGGALCRTAGRFRHGPGSVPSRAGGEPWNRHRREGRAPGRPMRCFAARQPAAWHRALAPGRLDGRRGRVSRRCKTSKADGAGLEAASVLRRLGGGRPVLPISGGLEEISTGRRGASGAARADSCDEGASVSELSGKVKALGS